MNTEAELIIFLIVFPCCGHWLLVCFSTVFCHEMTFPTLESPGDRGLPGQQVPRCPRTIG